ncbi:MAG: tetratricopeptide (TPR) repeat protein [Polyangiales bacterium]|jgi:tetratricopeptide (TPR) repeat protein
MRTLLRSSVLALVLLASLPLSSSAQSNEVVALFEQGLEAYRLANYEEAERLFARAHTLEPLPDLSYNHARTLELLGRFGDAADVYARFLLEAPETNDREVIEARIQNLRDRQTREASADEQPEEGPRTRGPSLVGPLVVIGGGLALGVGGVVAGLAGTSAHETALERTTNQTDADAANRRATTLARTTNALFVLSGLALAAGATWLVVKLLRGGEGEAEREVSLELAPTGVLLRGVF